MYYRYRTFAERLGPHNAKSIVLHYFGVLALSYSLFSLRSWLVDYTDRCRCLSRLCEPPPVLLPHGAKTGFTQPTGCFIPSVTFHTILIYSVGAPILMPFGMVRATLGRFIMVYHKL